MENLLLHISCGEFPIAAGYSSDSFVNSKFVMDLNINELRY